MFFGLFIYIKIYIYMMKDILGIVSFRKLFYMIDLIFNKFIVRKIVMYF